jgi:hypothetical protein
MAWRKGKGAETQQVEQVPGLQPGQAVVSETVEQSDGETHIHRTVREWHPHAAERLRDIEAIIDSWGMRSSDSTPPARVLPPDELQSRVDKVTRRVKPTRKVVVKETVTDWVERPVPASEPEPELAVEETVAVHESSRPKGKRPFRMLGFIGQKSPKAAKAGKAAKKDSKSTATGKDLSDPEYQPQCAALTEDGQQCRNSARGVSRYCASHKGYQPPTAKGLAKRIEGDAWDPRDDVTDHQSVKGADTRPVVRKAKDTRIKVRKVAKRRPAKKNASKRRR